MILLGFTGICLPIVLQRNRERFLSLPRSRKWLVALGMPFVHLLAMAFCLEASHRSTTILLPRPFTTTAVVHYRPGDSRIEFRGGWKRSVGPAGSNDAEVLPDGREEFSSYLHESFIRRALAGPETIAIVGRAKREKDGTVQIILEIEAKDAMLFSAENLDDVRMFLDGRPLVESKPQSGRFQLTITGRPKTEA